MSMTTTVNYPFGAMILSPSTGIVLNNEMDDFSIPVVPPPGYLPPAPENYVRPGKRPLSSMSPTIVLKVLSALQLVEDLLLNATCYFLEEIL